MKMIYKKPVMEIKIIKTTDVITASGLTNGNVQTQSKFTSFKGERFKNEINF